MDCQTAYFELCEIRTFVHTYVMPRLFKMDSCIVKTDISGEISIPKFFVIILLLCTKYYKGKNKKSFLAPKGGRYTTSETSVEYFIIYGVKHNVSYFKFI